MDGLIVLNKPVGITSAAALYRVRKLTGQRRSGHAGTLDPAADGVLVICLGRATKLVEAIMNLGKVYRVAARLDVTSESYDSDRPLVPVDVARPPEEARVREALAAFVGEVEQVPPAISAVKIGGQPAYRLARRGVRPELKPRRVRIERIERIRYAWPELAFEVACGRGTYIRALIRDLGARLGTGGCLTGLTRLAVGPLRIEDSVRLGELEGAGAACRLIPLERARELVASAGSAAQHAQRAAASGACAGIQPVNE